jgi:hypothetical protein
MILFHHERRSFLGHASVVFSLAALAGGCGNNATQVSIHPVSGKVLLASGKPLSSGTICFEPVDAPGFKATGKIQPDGAFTMTTHEDGDGAAEGTSHVYIVPDGGQVKGPSSVPLKFTDAESSGISVTVRPGTNQLEPIVLTSKKKAVARAR